jgi:hypothetical protein
MHVGDSSWYLIGQRNEGSKIRLPIIDSSTISLMFLDKQSYLMKLYSKIACPGTCVGPAVGANEGHHVGRVVGTTVGSEIGFDDGSTDGLRVVIVVGAVVGDTEGRAVGFTDGAPFISMALPRSR